MDQNEPPIEVNGPGQDRYRVWTGQPPTRPSAPPLWPGADRRVTVEYFGPRGPRFDYALVGGGAFRGLPARVVVAIGVSPAHVSRFDESLAGTLDVVHWGLPDEYVPGVRSGCLMAWEALPASAAGTICLETFAHGRVGSSLAVFARVRRLAVSLLGAAEPLSAGALADLVRAIDVPR